MQTMLYRPERIESMPPAQQQHQQAQAIDTNAQYLQSLGQMESQSLAARMAGQALDQGAAR